MDDIESALSYLKSLNTTHSLYSIPPTQNLGKLKKVLIPNRSEIAKKFFEVLSEENIPSVAVITDVDIDQSWYEMADEVVFIGEYNNYYVPDIIIAAMILSGSNAVCPGYGLLSRNYDFVKKIEEYTKSSKKEIIFMGQNSSVIKATNHRLEVKKIARENNVSLFPWSANVDHIFDDAKKIGYPLVVKAIQIKTGRVTSPVYDEKELREELSFFQDQKIACYIEKYISQGLQIEVQLFNDLALGSKKYLSNKVRHRTLEETGDFFLNRNLVSMIFAASEMMGRAYGAGSYKGFATVHFLFDHNTEKFGLLGFKPCLDSGYSVIEQTLEIDLIKWSILSYDGREQDIDYNYILKNRFLSPNHSIQCQIYAEDTEHNYIPSPGKITDITYAPLTKIRYDLGFVAEDSILSDYDNSIGKIIAAGKTREKAISTLKRALDKIYIKGVETNLSFLSNILINQEFIDGVYSGEFLNQDTQFKKIDINDDESRTIAVLGVLSSHVHANYKLYLQSSFEPGLKDFMFRAERNNMPDSYTISIVNHEYNYQITLIQISLEEYYIFIDRSFFCLANVHARIEQGNRYLIKFNSNTYKLRLDIQKEYTSLKTWSNLGWIKYCKVQIVAENHHDESNHMGMVRTPFQSSFVKLFDARPNKKIKKGSPVIMISAMKMETTIQAPVSGRLTYLIENGELSKLQLEKTIEGLIVGRNLKEGELLFVIEDEENISEKQSDSSKGGKDRNTQLEVVSQFLINTQIKWLKDPAGNISAIYDTFLLIKSYLGGFIHEANITPQFSKAFLKFNSAKLPAVEEITIESHVLDLIHFYTNIKLLHMYSYADNRELSNFDEMNLAYLRMKKKKFYFQDLSIRFVLDDVFRYYGLDDWSHKTSKEFGKIQYIFWCIEKAFHICEKSTHIIKLLVEALFRLQTSPEKKYQLVNKLLNVEKENPDNSLYLFLLEKLNQYGYPSTIQNLDDEEKWPVEIWAQKTFDQNNFHEFTIDDIDSKLFLNPKTGKTEIKRVGSKIYLGKIGGHEACFYMKDSRVSGGATGDLEGLKYVAACYISFFKKIPLYVWNDGAGANIKEGMISLNRAAEGFMFNALIGAKVNEAEFHNYVMKLPDKKIQALYRKLHDQFYKERTKNDSASFIISVGIGSSTGLDVYGSSQTGVQVMLDSNVSYRVLTGSAVIKSVTGEDISNYEIGGAKVMGRITGTADLIAHTKLEIIDYVQRLQDIFAPEKKIKSILRIKNKAIEKKDFLKTSDLLNLATIKENVDHGEFISFKEDFYEAGSIIGGFARIGGRHVLILGARTSFSIESLSCIIKSQELLDIAYKTGSSQIIFWRENTYNKEIKETPLIFRAKRNLIQSLSKKSKTKIYVITHINAMHHITINFFADVIIFVKQKKMNQKDLDFAKKVSTFVVQSLSEAFDLSHKIINLLSPLKYSKHKLKASKTYDSIIPSDTTEPYDIINNVISKISDEGTFLEFFDGMNDKMSGPALITGIAEIGKNQIGILADQPKILGGAPESHGTEKFRMFVEFLDKNQIPLLMLSNSPGFLPGKKQELFRIQQIGGKSLDMNILSNIPVVSVVLNQNYGGRLIHAFGKHLRPGIVYLTLENSVLAVMGATTSFDLFLKKKFEALLENNQKDEALAIKKQYIKDFNEKSYAKNDAFNTNCIDWLIKDKTKIRDHILCGLQLAQLRKEMIDNIELTQAKTCTSNFKQKSLELISKIFLLNEIKTELKKDSVYLSDTQEEILYENIQSFILGYQGLVMPQGSQ